MLLLNVHDVCQLSTRKASHTNTCKYKTCGELTSVEKWRCRKSGVGNLTQCRISDTKR